jgi:hypothetical protein
MGEVQGRLPIAPECGGHDASPVRAVAVLTLLIACAAAPAAARADVGGAIFTIAGADSSHDLEEGQRATSAGLDLVAPVTVLPDGDVLFGADDEVWRIHEGVLHRVAGSGEVGDAGDGGPARDAELWVDDLAALPDGGFLVADGEDGRIRMVDPRGTITTVAGGGLLRGNGVPAREADIGQSFEVAADPRGGFVLIDDDTRVRRVTPDGRISTIAGTGGSPDVAPDARGQPATSVPLAAYDVAVAADGSVLLADEGGQVDRVAPDGTITAPVPHQNGLDFEPTAIAAQADGGFVVIDRPLRPGALIWRVAADGTRTPLAGGGPLQWTAPAGLAQRLDGAPAAGAVLNAPDAIAVAPDGGVVFSDLIEDRGSYGSLIRYVAPTAPGRLAVALQRDGRRVLGPHAAVGVSLTQPATMALTVAGRTTTAALPAGASQVALPPGLPLGRPLMVQVAAGGAGGARAYDRARVYPPRWLPSELARLVTDGVHPGAPLDACRRFGALRVDCRQDVHHRKGCVTTSVRLAAARLRWGRYGCRFASRPRFRIRPHRLRRREWTCRLDVTMCPPAIFGRVTEADLLPSD